MEQEVIVEQKENVEQEDFVDPSHLDNKILLFHILLLLNKKRMWNKRILLSR